MTDTYGGSGYTDLYLALTDPDRRCPEKPKDPASRLRPFEEWTEKDGDVLCFRWPIEEQPAVSNPLSSDWLVFEDAVGPKLGYVHSVDTWERWNPPEGFSDYYTHWLPLPDCRKLWIDEE